MVALNAGSANGAKQRDTCSSMVMVGYPEAGTGRGVTAPPPRSTARTKASPRNRTIATARRGGSGSTPFRHPRTTAFSGSSSASEYTNRDDGDDASGGCARRISRARLISLTVSGSSGCRGTSVSCDGGLGFVRSPFRHPHGANRVQLLPAAAAASKSEVVGVSMPRGRWNAERSTRRTRAAPRARKMSRSREVE